MQMADPWLNDPIWLQYQEAANKAGVTYEKRAKIIAEAMDYLARTYWRQSQMDFGMMPAKTQVTVQQGSLF